MTKQTTLELADYYDNFDGSVYSTPAKANAVMLCLLQEAAEELRRLHEVNAELLEALKWAVACLHFDSEDMPEAADKLSKAKAAITKAKGGAV